MGFLTAIYWVVFWEAAFIFGTATFVALAVVASVATFKAVRLFNRLMEY